MYRTESDQSMGDSDENIMEHLTEGGVTIKQQLERKKQVSSFYKSMKIISRYSFIYGDYNIYIT